jgi:hypothetical protein
MRLAKRKDRLKPTQPKDVLPFTAVDLEFVWCEEHADYDVIEYTRNGAMLYVMQTHSAIMRSKANRHEVRRLISKLRKSGMNESAQLWARRIKNW